MLRNAKTMLGYGLGAVDGEIGKIGDLYFDDRLWIVRYLVADTGGWLAGRSVLISPYAVTGLDTESEIIATNLTKDQIENSPSASEAVPVSRQLEATINEYYGWPMYWYEAGSWGAYAVPPVAPVVPVAPVPEREEETKEKEESWDSDLRSAREVVGYKVEANDGDIGHVADMLIDDESWAIHYLVINTRNWWPGKHVLVSWKWADSVSWPEREIRVQLSRDAIEEAPEYEQGMAVTREYEMGLFRHYGKKGYWTEEDSDRG